MTDIFGKTPCDYQHLRDAHEKSPDSLKEYLQSSAQKHGNEPHNFNFDHSLLENASPQATVELMNENRQALQDVVDDELYEKRYADYLPMITMHDRAEIRKYCVMHEMLESVYRDRPIELIGSMENVPYSIYNHKHVTEIPARYRLKKSTSSITAIDDEHLQLAAQRVLKYIEEMLFKGQKCSDVKGFVNLSASTTAPIGGPNVRIVDTGTDGYFYTNHGNNGYEIVNKINEWISQFINDSKTIIRNEINDGVTIYLPDTHYDEMKHQSINRAGKPVTLRPMQELVGASTTHGRRDRAIIALNNKDIMEWAMLIPPRVIDVTYWGSYIRVTIEYAFSALQVKQPAGIRYIDGV